MGKRRAGHRIHQLYLAVELTRGQEGSGGSDAEINELELECWRFEVGRMCI